MSVPAPLLLLDAVLTLSIWAALFFGPLWLSAASDESARLAREACA